MTPISILPVAGLMLTLGIFLEIDILKSTGKIVFNNIAVIFAIGIASTYSKDSFAGLAAFLMYLVFNSTISEVLNIGTVEAIDSAYFVLNLGIPTLETGVLGGFIIGFLTHLSFKCFKDVTLPDYLAFFSGRRLAIMMSVLIAIPLGMIFPYLWIPVQDAVSNFSNVVVQANIPLASFIYGVVERFLVPLGLQHIWNVPFYYNFGQYVNEAGQIFQGDIPIFFAQLADGVPITAGAFMTGRFPIMLFALPASALAIYNSAYDNQKSKTKGMMLASALICFMAGITEPLEFTFLFVAPFLYGVHILFAGLSFMLMSIMSVNIGHPFSGGVIDFILYGIIPGKTKWWLVIFVGLIYAVIYYVIFRAYITKFDVKTPGREDEEKDLKSAVPLLNTRNKRKDKALNIINSVGGVGNIEFVDACMSRLRLTLMKPELIDKEKLSQLGYNDIMDFDDGNIQLIVGATAPILSDDIQTQVYQYERKRG